MTSLPRIAATGRSLLIGGAFFVLFTYPAQAQSMSGRSRLELRLGVGFRTNTGTSVGAGGIETKTEAAGLLGGFTYARWSSDQLAYTVGLGVLSMDAKTSVGAGGVETRTALVMPILVGVRRYLAASDPGSGVRPFGSVEAGPFIGHESATAVGPSIGTESHTRTAFGGRLGAGIDFGLGARVSLGMQAGYDLMTDFAEPIGGKSNHSGFEFGLAVGLLFGSG
jgi:hypothetical protein